MNLTSIASILSISLNEDKVMSTGFCIDSRVLQPGNVFIALKGEFFDGHNYIKSAVEKGASAIISEFSVDDVIIPQLIVPNSLLALGLLAAAHRQSIQCPIIGLTGSNGKTTVKEMIASILPKPAYATVGNFNNHIGVPLSLLQLTSEHQYAVFELGANHLGEIAYTAAMVKPQVALINNIAPAHIEGFGSIDNVAKAKGEIYQNLANGGTAIINDDDEYAHFWDETLIDKKIIRFSAVKASNIYAINTYTNEKDCAVFDLILPNESHKIYLQVPGKHNVNNALAAASSCFALGISSKDIVTGLNNFIGVSGRITYKKGKNQSLIIDDTYNANLVSVSTALELLAVQKGKRIFVFGDMGELGAWTIEHHKEVGKITKKLGIEQLLTCGEYSLFAAQTFGETAKHYLNQTDLLTDLLSCLDADTTVLVKGSRSSAMEKIVNQIIN